VLARVDLVREQIQIAAGRRLSFVQEDVQINGWSMMCRVRANDPWRDFLSSPGRLKRVHLPGGPQVRVDTYITCNCEVPSEIGPLLANLIVRGQNRDLCLKRLERALEDFTISGTPTNLPLLQRIAAAPEFVDGDYSTAFQVPLFDEPPAQGDDHRWAAVRNHFR